MSRHGILVTSEEAESIDASDAVRQSVDAAELRELLGDELLDLEWVPEERVVRAYVSAATQGAAEKATSAIEKRYGSGSPVQVVEVSSPSRRDLAVIQSDVMSRVGSLELRGTVSSSMDPSCGEILIIVDDELDISDVREASKDSKENVTVVLSGAEPIVPADRNNHHHGDQDGGLTIRPWDESTSSYRLTCTQAISIKRGNGQYVVTAAHCLGDDNSVASTSLQWACDVRMVQGGIFVTTGSNCARYQLGGRVDAVAKWKYSWEGGWKDHITHGNHTTVSMNHWDQSRLWLMSGDILCHSGRNWAGSPCGGIQSFTSSACYPAAPGSWPAYCVDTLVDTSMTVYPGDSGGTVWVQDGSLNSYVGIVHNTGGAIVHLEDLIDALDLDVPVGF